jgi:peptide/nickel transport system substrate-binding protein
MATYVQLVQNGEKPVDGGTSEVDPTTVDPYFASDWTVSDDGLSYTFTLQPDWTFPSGEPMNAEAVKYSLDRVNTINSCGAAIINDLYLEPKLITSIEVVDDQTVTINLNQPDGDFLLALATPSGSIVDPSLVEANGGVVADTANEWMASNDAGSGPFRLESFEPGTSAVLKRDPNFKGDPGASETININWVKSDSALLLQIQNGTVDLAQGLSKNSAKSIDGTDGLQVVASTATANMQFLMPNDKAPWDNEQLREAVTYAIPYEDILDNVLQGYGELYYGPIPPTMPGYDEADSAPRTYDLDKAKELVAASGAVLPVTVPLDIISGDAAQASIATILQSALAEIGINLEVNSLSESAWADQVYNFKTQAALRLDGPAVFSAGYYLQYDADCDSVYNDGRICVPANTQLLKDARGAATTDERDAALAELTANWVADSPKAVLYLDATAVVMKEGFQYVWNPITDMRTWSVG